MGDNYPKTRVAAVQAAPVFLNREASVEKACRLISKAGANGAKVIGFPEGFIPAHPTWYHFHAPMSQKGFGYAAELFKNSVEIPSPATDALCQAARDASAYIVMGLCEKLPGTNGTMYNTQLFIDRSGRILGKHQKLMPTIGERLVHTVGDAATLRTFDTEFGPISGLICGENSNLLAIFTLLAQSTRIHVSCWPHFFPPHFSKMRDVTFFACQSLAYQTKAFVISACGTIDDEMLRAHVVTPEDRAFLEDPTMCGGSTIISPAGKIIAGPMGPEEGILYADIDLEEGMRGKLVHDFAGHYNRADVFQLNVSAMTPPIYNRVPGPSPTIGSLSPMSGRPEGSAKVLAVGAGAPGEGPAVHAKGEAEPVRR